MAGLERGRSPSAGQATHIRHSTSASPHPPLDHSFNGASNGGLAHDPFASGVSFADPSFTQDYTQQTKWSLGPTYTDFHQQQQQQEQAHRAQPPLLPSQQATDFTNSIYSQSAGITPYDYGHIGHESNHVSPSALTQSTTSPTSTSDSSAFPSFDFNQTAYELHQQNFGTSASLDPSLLSGLDPIDQLSQPRADSLNGSHLPMAATMQSHSPTPPHLFPDMAARRHSGSPSPHATPGFPQNGFQSFNRPRNTSESLDPASAMFPQAGQNEWAQMNMGPYRHRRTPSDNYSEISSHSNQASPYMGTLDNFDGNAHSSPLLNPTQDPAFNGDLGLQGFTIGENQIPQQQNYVSPGQSPQPSPRLVPQQTLPAFTAENNYGLMNNMNGQYMQQPTTVDLFPAQAQEPFPALSNHASPGDMGAADQTSPPEINIEFAPSTKNPMEHLRSTHAEDTLSPPARAPSRNRSKSDSYAGSRPSSPAVSGRGRSPSLQPSTSDPSSLLTPLDNGPPSRSPSPVRGRNGSLSGRARSTSHASDQRDYILDLANPERTPSNGADKGRVQKHPATFQCTLCPKRFTRAYNLRSHLRTHTDERPFVCTVCGKAFARQHDRKRHEGLHSGEKKFVCRGNLQSSAQSQWGCGRRFARADALGRHFRSEAGRVCIKPLLDEEAAERQKAWIGEHQHAQVAAGLVAPQPMLQQPQIDMMGNFLPAALLQQYPALAGLDWNNIPQGPPPEEEYSGRSSYDAASSGGEYYDDMSENEMGYADPTTMVGGGMNNMTSMSNNMSGMTQQQHMNMQQHAQAGAQGYGSGGIYGNQAGDYMSDFEGR